MKIVYNELILNNSYLIEKNTYPVLNKIMVLCVTNVAYQFLYESGETEWIKKDKFFNEFTIIENITDLVINKNNNIITHITCGCCYGEGTVPDSKSTVGTKICPVCYGSKQILQEIKTLH